ncbi:hypothetical protein RB620_24535 [Paenibacillus sp. LHD-117]|uniref:hypothetical protein n=1 Tax=Paenibacillus sp. LHD-117 TaxID=3071412 RepID=UPI0027DFEE42|nr:hypothetical protein [Paenibacillus sp. LHD-117]MDQ6422604.1 hypothetical protein [Paenibacillus sp. LHD-117]
MARSSRRWGSSCGTGRIRIFRLLLPRDRSCSLARRSRRWGELRHRPDPDLPVAAAAIVPGPWPGAVGDGGAPTCGTGRIRICRSRLPLRAWPAFLPVLFF